MIVVYNPYSPTMMVPTVTMMITMMMVIGLHLATKAPPGKKQVFVQARVRHPPNFCCLRGQLHAYRNTHCLWDGTYVKFYAADLIRLISSLISKN